MKKRGFLQGVRLKYLEIVKLFRSEKIRDPRTRLTSISIFSHNHAPFTMVKC